MRRAKKSDLTDEQLVASLADSIATVAYEAARIKAEQILMEFVRQMRKP